MTTLTILIVVAFVLGYACIATESLLKVNKAAIALLMFVACWTLYMFDPMQYLTAIHGYTGDLSGMAAAVTSIIQEHLGDTSTTLFFLMGAMMLMIWWPKKNSTTPFHWHWSIVFISIFLSAADFVYFYALSLPGAMISIVSMVRRGSVIVSFLFGAAIFHEKNLKAKFVDLLLVLLGMLFLYFGTK